MATAPAAAPPPAAAPAAPSNGAPSVEDVPRPRRSPLAGREVAAYALATFFVFFEAVLAALILYLTVLALADPPLDVQLAGRPLTFFQVAPLILVFGWLGLLAGYLAWGTFFYNFNFGRSARFWKGFSERVQQARLEGKTESEVFDEMAAPRQNPYADQTFGLPPGTIRGMLALTIVVGGMALLISFFGGEAFFETGNAAIVHDYFDFFKTAFLMVVAFYFGTKGLDIIERERTKRQNAQARAAAPSFPFSQGPPPSPSLLELDAATGDGASAFAPIPPPETERDVPDAAPALKKKVTSVRDELLDRLYPHVADLEVEERQRVELGPEDLERAAEETELELPLVRAVTEVESRGSGFLPSGRPKILFEGHVFWRQLVKREIDPAPHAAAHPSIVYRRWTRRHYLGGEAEHERLAVARAIHESAALCSASWGMFQIMGFNHAVCGFETVQAFVEAQETSEKEHLTAFLRFLEHTKGRDGRTLLELLRAREWAAFAHGYNGPGYAQNRYDVKLEAAYRRFSA